MVVPAAPAAAEPLKIPAGIAAPAAAEPPEPKKPSMADIITETVAKWKPAVKDSVGTLRGSLTGLEDHVATLHHFSKQVPKAEKAVNRFHNLAVEATNRLQKSIGLPEGPI